MITVREIGLDELQERVYEIDVSEQGTVVYYWLDGQVTPVSETWERPQWTRDAWREDSWATVLGKPGVKAWGAFEDDRMVGIVVYRPHLTEHMAQLAALFVDGQHRRQGVAAQLTERVIQQAKADGYAALYVSATPSESAVNFYRAQGFVPTQETNPELYALEPEDIHMIKGLSDESRTNL